MFDHITLNVRDIGASRRFYEKALAPLGYSVATEWETGVGLGAKGVIDLWLRQEGEPTGACHVALRAKDRATVDAFYRAAIEAGGRDNGAPGLRPQYHEQYYGAFVLDPDGVNLETVCHS